ncbi:hypothetical protein MNBD_GAMMA14-1701, partial [hydrothermal vent metagenome]
HLNVLVVLSNKALKLTGLGLGALRQWLRRYFLSRGRQLN